jgi:3-methyl-2-oxobutanoate hydroxymethyltransferase
MISWQKYIAYKNEARKISMITCYDACLGRIVAQSEIDWVLVGDSVSMVLHGHASTIMATPEMMTLHTSAVARSIKNKPIIADMPFLSFRKGIPFALDVAAQLMQAGADAVKLEGLSGHEEVVSHLVETGIPVMGHLGLTPQSVHQLGGHKVQGRLEADSQKLLADALELEKRGCFALVLECIPHALAKEVSSKLSIPTIGIGAGPDVDGQVLVLHDMLGFDPSFKPKFLRHYAQLEGASLEALNHFAADVRERTFPNFEESYL